MQDPTPPNYKYVSTEGPFTIQPVDLELDIHPMAIRYFGVENGERFFADICRGEDWKTDIIVRIQPECWLTVDYSKLSPAPESSSA